jgi:hypothetical protein
MEGNTGSTVLGSTITSEGASFLHTMERTQHAHIQNL